MLTNEQRKEFLKKELEISKRYLEMVDVLQEVTKGFIGKVFNKRYEAALEEAINKRFSSGERKEFFVKAEPLSNLFNIRITCSDNHMVFNQDQGRHDMAMFRNHSKSFVLPPECTDITESGKIRFEKEMLDALEEHKTKLQEVIEEQKQDLDMCDDILDDFQKAQKAVAEFEEKYSYSLRDAFGVLYAYVNQGTYEFRN